eukprot:9474552-Pyramimonas_sp.AAC.1
MSGNQTLMLIVLLWISGDVAGAIMHTNDMLKPLGGLRMSGWVAEGAGCILEGGAENILFIYYLLFVYCYGHGFGYKMSGK